MIKDKKLLIDNDCPMCGLYGAAFTKMGLIDKCTLHPYQAVGPDLAADIDMDRARNAIAFYSESGTVYGVDAFIEIISQGSKAVKAILEFAPVYFFITFLYNIISYNRKLIYPTRNASGVTCIPDKNLTFRWIYIVLVALVTGMLLQEFGLRVMTGFGFEQHPYLEWVMCFGQIAWQGVFVNILRKEKAMDYLGNMSTVSLIGGILVAIILGVGSLVTLDPWAYLLLFGGVVGIMLWEHIRRCSILNLPLSLTASWIVFRTVFLLIILYNIGLL